MPPEEMGYTLQDHDLLVANKIILGELTGRVEKYEQEVEILQKQLGGGMWERIALWALGVLWLVLTSSMVYLWTDHQRVSSLQHGRLTREEQLAIRDGVVQMKTHIENLERRIQQMENRRTSLDTPRSPDGL